MPIGVYKRTKPPWNKGKKLVKTRKTYKEIREEKKKPCPNCGKLIHSTSKMCVRCSNKLINRKRNVSRKWSEEAKKGRRGVDNPNWKGGDLLPSRYKRKRDAVGSHTFGEWKLLKKQYGYRCPCCGKKEPEIKLTEDHIIPLSKGGSDYIENIQPLCRSCNSAKHTIIKDFRKNGS